MASPAEFHRAVKIRAILHCDAAGMNLALKIGTVADVNISLGQYIANHLTTDAGILAWILPSTLPVGPMAKF